MSGLAHPCVDIQTEELPHPSMPSWFAEIVLMATALRKQGRLSALTEQVRLPRGRFGHYEVIDFLAVLFAYAVSGEQTLQAFFERAESVATPLMALFERDQMPHRSSLSRFLADVTPACLDAVRQQFVQASFCWGWTNETIGGIWDRTGARYLVFDIDGTREAARQRKLPAGPDLPKAHRRLDGLCAPGFTGHRRGEQVRTRTTVLQMHTRQWLGTFGGRGNGDYRAELQAALHAVATYLEEWHLSPGQGIVRVDGQYGDARIIAKILATGTHVVVRKKGFQILDHPRIQAALTHAPVATIITQESQVTYELFDLPDMVLDADMPAVRLLLTRRAWHGEPISVGKVIGEWVYEQYVTTLPCEGFLATDILDLYQGRGAFEGTLADEDREGDPDRWCSLSPCGQECWQVLWQWVWNLRLALSVGISDDVLRSMEWAPEHEGTPQTIAVPVPNETPTYGPLEWARARGSRFAATDFVLQKDGRLRCPQGMLLWHSETRQETPNTQRLIYVAYDADCVGCPQRTACLGRTASGKRGRRVSAVQHQQVTTQQLLPLPTTATDAIHWKDVAGRQLRRTWMAHWRQQTVTWTLLPLVIPPVRDSDRAVRSHRRLSWRVRTARNACEPLPFGTVQISGVSSRLVELLG